MLYPSNSRETAAPIFIVPTWLAKYWSSHSWRWPSWTYGPRSGNGDKNARLGWNITSAATLFTLLTVGYAKDGRRPRIRPDGMAAPFKPATPGWRPLLWFWPSHW